jgi:hypothetical protein
LRGARVVQTVGLREELEVLIDGELVAQQRHLGAVAKARPALDRPRVAREEADDDLHQNALSGAVLAYEPDKLTRLHVERGAAQDVETAPMPGAGRS